MALYNTYAARAFCYGTRRYGEAENDKASIHFSSIKTVNSEFVTSFDGNLVEIWRFV